jgi:DNA-binding SARP family transcriptional activator/Tfp pilus assembly protein PilF
VSGSGGAEAGSRPLEIRLLGAFEVLRDGKPVPDSAWGRRKTKTLLKVLLTRPGQTFSQDQLIEALFEGDNPVRTVQNLYNRVSELRRALEPDLKRGSDSRFVLRHGQGYLFDPAGVLLDTSAFERGLGAAAPRAKANELPAAVEHYEDAVALYRGEFLPEDRYEPWAEEPRSRLQAQYLEALADLAQCHEALGRLRQAITCCQRVLQIEPYRESVVRQLMEYQAATGQRAQALETYETGVRALREHLDVEPAAQTRALYERISRQADEETKLDPRRVAVIPFVNVGADPANEVLSDGMTEELIYTLSRVAGLQVIAQTSVLRYKGQRRRVGEIGRELRAGSLIEGSTQKTDGKARILVQLVDVESETHLWAEEYDRDLVDVLSLQGEIARRVAEALEVTLLAKEKRGIRREDATRAEARTAYMKGRVFLAQRTRTGFEQAIASFETALRIEPDYARALTGLADVYALRVGFVSSGEELEKAAEYVERALEVDPACAEAHATLGYILQANGDMVGAEAEFLKAIEINPNDAQAHAWYADLLTNTGRYKEACARSEMALELDPLSATVNQTYAWSLREAGRLVEAVQQYERVLDLNPALEDAWWDLWYCLAAQWDWEQVEAVTRRCVAKFEDNPFAHVTRAQSLGCLQRHAESAAELSKALALAGDPVPPYVLLQAGYAYYFRREYNRAIETLRRVLERTPTWTFIHVMIGRCYLLMGRYDEALEELDLGDRPSLGADDFFNAILHAARGRIYALRGEVEKAESELAILMSAPGKRSRYLAMCGILFALGRTEEAMDRLEDAATAREAHLVTLAIDPCLDAMRSHPRFQAVLRRIGLPDDSGEMDGRTGDAGASSRSGL